MQELPHRRTGLADTGGLRKKGWYKLRLQDETAQVPAPALQTSALWS